MQTNIFRINCLTNLHVGSGDINYNIVDKEVQTDPVTGYPIIHASGVKGAFKDAYQGNDEETIFGRAGDDTNGINGGGSYKFFDARFLSRPLRVGGNSDVVYINVTTVTAINNFIEQAEAFKPELDVQPISIIFPENTDFFVSDSSITNIEGSANISMMDEASKATIKKILGLGDNEPFAVAKDINNFSLPVIARNRLDEIKNLWYEEFVPHHSKFYLIVLTPDNEAFNLDITGTIQFGGNASVGYGYCMVEGFDKTEA